MALADWTDIFTGGAGAAAAGFRRVETQCVEAANKSSSVLEIENKTNDLTFNWHPTGFYTSSDIRQLVAAVTGATNAARLALTQAPHSTGDAAYNIKEAGHKLDQNLERAKRYLDGSAKAEAAGKALDAPGLKLWVTNSMVNIASAYAVVATLQCRVTWLDHAAALITAIWNVAKRIVGVVLAAGEAALQIVEGVWDLVPYLKWGVIGVGLLFTGAILRRRFISLWRADPDFPKRKRWREVLPGGESKPKPVAGRRLVGRR
jgi:hypothetical protein